MAIARFLPSFIASGETTTPSRTWSYGEAVAILMGAKQDPLAQEGSYFTTYNVTDGTGIAGHAAPVQADLSTKPLLHIFNSHASKSIIVDFVRLRATAIGAGATTTDLTTWVDLNGATNKSSGGTVATVVNSNPAASNAFSGTVTFGAVVAVAGTGEVRTDHQRIRSVVAVVEDQYFLTFGAANYGPPTGGVTMAGTAVVGLHVHLAPLVIPPGGNGKIVQWGASQSGAHSFEYTIGMTQR